MRKKLGAIFVVDLWLSPPRECLLRCQKNYFYLQDETYYYIFRKKYRWTLGICKFQSGKYCPYGNFALWFVSRLATWFCRYAVTTWFICIMIMQKTWHWSWLSWLILSCDTSMKRYFEALQSSNKSDSISSIIFDITGKTAMTFDPIKFSTVKSVEV